MPKIKRIVKFNGGNGAILCNNCGIIVKVNLSRADIDDDTPVYCKDCMKNFSIVLEHNNNQNE